MKLVALGRLWNPLDRRVPLAAVLVKNDEGDVTRITERGSIDQALAAAWAPTFQAGKVDTVLGDSMLRNWATPWDWAEAAPPGINDYLQCMGRAVDSAPGPDGIPFAAWRSAGLCGAQTLHQVDTRLRQSLLMPTTFTEGICVYPPKGTEADDETNGAARTPENTRPLTLRNCDAKVIASAWNHSLKKSLQNKPVHCKRDLCMGGSWWKTRWSST